MESLSIFVAIIAMMMATTIIALADISSLGLSYGLKVAQAIDGFRYG